MPVMGSPSVHLRHFTATAALGAERRITRMPDLNHESADTASARPTGIAGQETASSSSTVKEFIYHDDLDYLEDIRLLLYEGKKERRVPYPSPVDNREFRIQWEQIQEKKTATRRLTGGLRIDNLVIDFELDELQELILSGLAVEQLIGNRVVPNLDEFIKIITGEDIRTVINARHAWDELKKKRLVFEKEQYRSEAAAHLDRDILNYLAEGKPIRADKFKEDSKPKPKLADVIKGLAEKFPTPQSIYLELEKHVVGQKEAKRTLSVAAFNHLRRIQGPGDSGEGVKPNVMLVGPTGCGKTHLVKTLASILGLPYAIGDATSWTEAGYVGSDYDEVLWALFENTGNDIEFAQRGIVFIDEVDKLATRDKEDRRDIGGAGVQRALLKPLEGSTVTMAKRGEHTFMAFQKNIDTRAIFFVLGGAFDSLAKLAEKRAPARSIGFGPGEYSPASASIATEDLVAYGMLRELVGRVPIIAGIRPLDLDELVEIMVRPERGLIAEINRSCEPCGLRFEFTPAAVRQLAGKALEEGTGARSLRGVINTLIEPHVFEHSRAKPAGVRVVEIAA